MVLQPEDEIDRLILKKLSSNPRIPYADIADYLAREGHEMSSEGVRGRVSKLLEQTSIFFLIDTQQHQWEIVRLVVTTAEAPSARERVFEDVSDLPFWIVTDGLGSFDIYAVAAVASVVEANQLVTEVEEMEGVENVEFSVETNRNANVDDYFTAGRRDEYGPE